MVMTCPPTYHFWKFLMKNMILTNSYSGLIIIMIVMHRPQKEYDVHVLISYIQIKFMC